MPEGLMGRLRERFGDPPDIVSFSGITEVVDDLRRVYLTPEVDAWVEFPEADSHVESFGGPSDTVWVSSRQPVVFRALGVHVAGYIEGEIVNGSLQMELDAAALLRKFAGGFRGLCLSKSTRTLRCGYWRDARGWPDPGPFRAQPGGLGR